MALLTLFILTVGLAAFQKEARLSPLTKIEALTQNFFYISFLRYFFNNEAADNLLRSLVCGQTTSRFFFLTFSFLALSRKEVGRKLFYHDSFSKEFFILLGIIFLFLFLLLFFGDLLPRMIGLRLRRRSFPWLGRLVSIFLIPLSPIIYFYLKGIHLFSPHKLKKHSAFDVKEKIIEMIEEGSKSTPLDPTEQKLVESILTFRQKLAKEVMIPRVDMVSLPASTPVNEAVKLLIEENYSRIPVYEKGMDHITGILLHKELFNYYFASLGAPDGEIKEKLETPIGKLAKEPLFTPETKKISHLLNAFREQQTHMGIVVDEYGRTEGLITIEDILEELVGEISDEYDEEEPQFFPLKDGGFLVDAQMTLLDAREKLNLEIPQEGDYDTIGGYISFLAGSIPPKGSVLDHDNFHMEIVEANERMVKQVRITPTEDEDE